MACTLPFREWTIDFKSDPRNGKKYVEETLVFCLRIDETSGDVIGEVFDTAGTKLSDVTGRSVPTGQMRVNFIGLAFTWDPSDVFLAGMTFVAGSVTFISGRFITEAAAGPSLFVGPDPGETGTGTGQQT